MVHTDNAWPKLTMNRGFRGYHLIFGVGFLVFLFIALAGQMLGWHWRTWLPGAEGVKSLFGGVKAAVYTFMSHVL